MPLVVTDSLSVGDLPLCLNFQDIRIEIREAVRELTDNIRDIADKQNKFDFRQELVNDTQNLFDDNEEHTIEIFTTYRDTSKVTGIEIFPVKDYLEALLNDRRSGRIEISATEISIISDLKFDEDTQRWRAVARFIQTYERVHYDIIEGAEARRRVTYSDVTSKTVEVFVDVLDCYTKNGKLKEGGCCAILLGDIKADSVRKGIS